VWLLPWEKWLPAWIVAPLLCGGSIAALVLDHTLSWWQYILLPLSAALGAWATYVWFKDGRHIFREAFDSVEPKKEERP
jgi:hypothetical protein